MKLLILVIILKWSFAVGLEGTTYYKIVDSPKHAAEIVLKKEQSNHGPDANQYEYKLYEVDFDAGVVKQVKLPTAKMIYE